VRDRAAEGHGNEAKEFLRKRFIGKEVSVKMEYTRKVGGPMPGAEGAAAAAAGEVSGACMSGAKACDDCRAQRA